MQVYRVRTLFASFWKERIWGRNQVGWEYWVAQNSKKQKVKFERIANYQRRKVSKVGRKEWLGQNA